MTGRPNGTLGQDKEHARLGSKYMSLTADYFAFSTGALLHLQTDKSLNGMTNANTSPSLQSPVVNTI